MANVPEYGQRRQTLRPAVTNKLKSTATPDAFGAGIGRAMQGLASGVRDLGAAFDEVKGMEDRAKVYERTNAFSDYTRERTYNPENGYITQEGENAVTGRAAFEQDLESKREQLAKDLTPAQRDMFNKASDARRRQALDTGIRHAAGERKKWFNDASTARLDTFANDAMAMADEPDKLAVTLAAARAEIADNAKAHGWSTEQTDAAQKEFVSGVNKNIVLKSAIDDPLKAKAWLDDHRDSMSQEHQFELDKALEQPVLYKRADDEAARIAGAGANRPQQVSVMGAMRSQQIKTANKGIDVEHLNEGTVGSFHKLQNILGTELTVKSGFRTKAANDAAQGAKHSQHLEGNAIDVDVRGMSKAQKLKLIDAAFDAGFTGFGIGANSIHIDQGTPRSWGYVRPSGGGTVPEYASGLINRRMEGLKASKSQATPKKTTKPPAWDGKSMRDGINETAAALGVDPIDIATIMMYETGGTMDPSKYGPTTQWGRHRGLIQFGEPQAKKYGVDWKKPLMSQLGKDGAVVKYFKDNGAKPGMGILDLYSIANAGAPGKYDASDANNGGAPGTVRDKVETQMNAHRQKAMKMMGATSTGVPGFVGPQYIANQVAHIADPKLRAATAERLAKMYNAQDAAKRRADRDNKIAVERFIIQNPNTDPTKLPMNMQLQLGLDGMNTLWSYQSQIEQNGAVQTDERLYAELQRLQAEDPAAFAEDVDLFDHIDKLSTKDRRALQQLQVDAITDKKKGTDKALTEARSISSAMTIADSRLEAAGVKKTGKDRNEESMKREAQFQRALIDRMREFQEQNSRVPNDYEVSDMVDELILPIIVETPGTLWGTNENEALLFEAPFRADNATARVSVPYEQIPVDVRLAIRQELAKELGREPTEDEVKEDYVEFILEGK